MARSTIHRIPSRNPSIPAPRSPVLSVNGRNSPAAGSSRNSGESSSSGSRSGTPTATGNSGSNTTIATDTRVGNNANCTASTIPSTESACSTPAAGTATISDNPTITVTVPGAITTADNASNGNNVSIITPIITPTTNNPPTTTTTTTTITGLPTPPTTPPQISFIFPPSPISADNNPPNRTIFIGNTPRNFSLLELSRLVRSLPGYQDHRFIAKPRNRTLLVSFRTMEDSAAARITLDGYRLRSAPTWWDGLRVSYAKSHLGMPRGWSDAPRGFRFDRETGVYVQDVVEAEIVPEVVPLFVPGTARGVGPMASPQEQYIVVPRGPDGNPVVYPESLIPAGLLDDDEEDGVDMVSVLTPEVVVEEAVVPKMKFERWGPGGVGLVAVAWIVDGVEVPIED